MTAAFWDVTAVLGCLMWVQLILACLICAFVVRDARRLRRERPPGPVTKPEPAIDDAVTMLKRWDAEAPARKPQAAPWPDDNTVVTDGMTTAINRMLKEDGRG